MVHVEAIPSELLERPQWVVWKFEVRDGKRTKVPYQVAAGARRKAASDDPSTWVSAIEAVRYARANEWVDGIGYMFAEEDPYFGIDLDGCRDPESGVVEPWAVAVVERFDTYAEASPSGRGVHIIGEGTLPPKGRKKGSVEVYDRLRYFTMTGERLTDRPETINDCQDTLGAWHREVWPEAEEGERPSPNGVARSSGSASMDDAAILLRMWNSKNGDRIRALWDGDTSAYARGDNDGESEADLALCSHLAFWTDRDAGRMDQLFRRSGLYRAKWDERRGSETYGQRTIAKAIEGCREGYRPPSGTGGVLSLSGTRQAGNGVASADDLLDEVPSFPVDALPPDFRLLVEQAAAALPCPPDFVAVPLLVAAGATIGNALELRVKRGWTEGPNLYAAVVGEPGAKKSPAFGVASQPLHRLQAMLKRNHDRQCAEHEERLEAWKKSKAPPEEKPQQPQYRHVLTTDATVEALAPMLISSKGVVMLRDELSGWVSGMNQYKGGKGSDRQHYLSMWSRTAIKVDRKGSPIPVYVPRPCLSVVGDTQPDMLPMLANPEQLEDGFIDRLLWSYPDPVRDAWTTAEIDDAVMERVAELFKRLYRLEPLHDSHGEAYPRPIGFGMVARDLWAAWYERHAAEMWESELSTPLRGAWSKLPGQLARLALILHTVGECQDVDRPVDDISGVAFEAAARIVDYFKAHARRVYKRLERGKRDYFAVLMTELRGRGEMTQSEIYRGVFHCNLSKEVVAGMLETAQSLGMVQSKTGKSTGGRRPVVWEAL